jgi:hypothetical protein
MGAIFGVACRPDLPMNAADGSDARELAAMRWAVCVLACQPNLSLA